MCAAIGISPREPRAQMRRLARTCNMNHNPVDCLTGTSPRKSRRRHYNCAGVIRSRQRQCGRGLGWRGGFNFMNRARDFSIFGRKVGNRSCTAFVSKRQCRGRRRYPDPVRTFVNVFWWHQRGRIFTCRYRIIRQQSVLIDIEFVRRESVVASISLSFNPSVAGPA